MYVFFHQVQISQYDVVNVVVNPSTISSVDKGIRPSYQRNSAGHSRL
jgi:hypothetical protein